MRWLWLMLLLLPTVSWAEDLLIRDKDHNTELRINDERILDRDYKIVGHIKNGKIYDKEWNRKGEIKDINTKGDK